MANFNGFVGTKEEAAKGTHTYSLLFWPDCFQFGDEIFFGGPGFFA